MKYFGIILDYIITINTLQPLHAFYRHLVKYPSFKYFILSFSEIIITQGDT